MRGIALVVGFGFGGETKSDVGSTVSSDSLAACEFYGINVHTYIHTSYKHTHRHTDTHAIVHTSIVY